MHTESAVRLLAGALVLVGLALGTAVDPLGYLLAAFVGANLVQSSVTGICPAEAVLRRLDVTSG